MQAFKEPGLSGPKSARMEQRTTAEAKALIERAAELLGVNASEFTVAAAAQAARETISRYETTVLAPEAHAAFLKALDATEPEPALVDLMKLHRDVASGR